MATIYTLNGRQVYDRDGQIFDAKTGQVVQKTTLTQQAPRTLSSQQTQFGGINQQIAEAQRLASLAQQQRQADITAGQRLEFDPGTARGVRPLNPTFQNPNGSLKSLDQINQERTARGNAPMTQEDLNQAQIERGLVSPQMPAVGDSEASQGQFGGLPPEFGELFSQLSGFIQEMRKRGQVLNPNVQITEKELSEFLRMAENEIEPGFRSQLRTAREGYLRQLGYNAEEVLSQERELEHKYGAGLRAIGEQEAERGFSLSGRRIQRERELAGETQEAINQRRRQLEFETGTKARAFGQQYGGLLGEPLPQAPSISRTPRVGIEGFERTTGEVPLYQISDDIYQGIIGEKERERIAGARNLAQFYEGQEREKRVIPL